MRRGNYATITGKAFRPRPMEIGRIAWMLLAVCCAYILVAVVLPLMALMLTSFQRFATVFWSRSSSPWPITRPRSRFAAVTVALVNSLMLGVGVATVGVLVMARVGVDHLPLAGAGARRSSNTS